MKINLNQLFGLEGRVAAVTGGGGELCGVIAEALAGLGVKVAILDVHREHAFIREEVIVENGGTARAFHCDVLDEANLKDCLAEISEQWEAPDILINGA